MPDEPVDGFSDTKSNNVQTQDPHDAIPGSPDPGVDPHAMPPLSPEERAKLEKEIREGTK